MAQYHFPTSDEKKLYLSEGMVLTIGDILEAAREHFGVHSALEELRFSCENIQITGCSCHYDPSDYSLYMVIERR